MKCAGCQRTFEPGDRYIEDTASGFSGARGNATADALISELFGGIGGKVAFCEDCTQEGGTHLFEIYYGDVDA